MNSWKAIYNGLGLLKVTRFGVCCVDASSTRLLFFGSCLFLDGGKQRTDKL